MNLHRIAQRLVMSGGICLGITLGMYLVTSVVVGVSSDGSPRSALPLVLCFIAMLSAFGLMLLGWLVNGIACEIDHKRKRPPILRRDDDRGKRGD